MRKINKLNAHFLGRAETPLAKGGEERKKKKKEKKRERDNHLF